MNPDESMPGRDFSDSSREYPTWMRWEDLGDVDSLERSTASTSPARRVLPYWKPAYPELRQDPAADARSFSGPAFALHPSGDGHDAAAQCCPPDFSVLDVRDRVVVTLLFKQIIGMDQVAEAWDHRENEGDADVTHPFWRSLADAPGVDRERIFAEAAAVAGFEPACIDRAAARDFARDQVYAFSERQWQRMLDRRVVPIERSLDRKSGKDRFVFATFDPSSPEVPRLMRELRIRDYVLRYASESEIEALIRDLAEGQESTGAGLAEMLFVDCLAEAMRREASAIHIRYEDGGIRIDFRVEDVLERWHAVSNVDADEFFWVVKEAGRHLDAANRDAVQDGEIGRAIDGRRIHFEVSVPPITKTGGAREGITLHLRAEPLSRSGLRRSGLPEHTCGLIERSLLESSGMIVVTGPPESRRSATVDAVTAEVASSSRRVIALDDVVENEGGRQVRTSSTLDHDNLDHGKALEAVCAYDPDIVVAGDLRTCRSAELALRLANRGRLVVAKISAYDSADALSRLVGMGIEPVLSAYAIDLIVAQRSVRRLCPACKRPVRHLDGQMLRRLGFSPQNVAAGSFYEEGAAEDCGTCGGTGYDGDRILTEAMPVSHDIRRVVALTEGQLDGEGVRALAVRDGMRTLRAAARDAVLEGEISVAELIRATAGDH